MAVPPLARSPSPYERICWSTGSGSRSGSANVRGASGAVLNGIIVTVSRSRKRENDPLAEVSAPDSAVSACLRASIRSPVIEPEVSSTNSVRDGLRTWFR